MAPRINRRATLKRIGLATTGIVGGLSATAGTAGASEDCLPELNVTPGDTWTDAVVKQGDINDRNFHADEESTWYVDEFLFVRYNGSNLDDGTCTTNPNVIHNFSVFSYSRSSARVWGTISQDHDWFDKMTGHGMRFTSPSANQHIEMPVTYNDGEVWEGPVIENTEEVEKSTVEREYQVDLADGAIAAAETLIAEVVDKSVVGWALAAKSVLGALFGGVEEKTFEDHDLGDTKELTWAGALPSAAYVHDLELQQPVDQLQGGERYRTPGSLYIESFHHDDMAHNGWSVYGRDAQETYTASVNIDVKNDADGLRGNR